MLKLVGLLRDLREFRKANADDDNGKIFEEFFLNMEMLRRVFRLSKSEVVVQRVKSIAEFYPTVRYSQNCDDFKFELVDKYKVVDIDCKRDFPSSNNPVDAAVVKRVKSLIGGSIFCQVFSPSSKQARKTKLVVMTSFSFSTISPLGRAMRSCSSRLSQQAVPL